VDLTAKGTRKLELTANRGSASITPILGRGAKGEDGSNVLPTDTAIAAKINDPASDTSAALSDSIARRNLLAALELMPFTNFGNSWSVGGVSSTPGAGYWSRFAARNRTKAQVNQGVSGTESGQILTQITSTWTPNSQGVVGLGDIVLNDLRHWGTDTDKATTRETFRAMLARLNSWVIQDSAATSLVYGPGWTSGTSDGTAGRYVDVAWSGPVANIRVGCVTGTGATITAKDTGTGATVATFSTGGFKVAFEGVIRLTGYSAGNHTVRVTVDAAATVAGVIVPMPNPPLILWVKAGDTIEGGTTQRARIALYLAECATVAAAYPNVLPVDLNGQGWDMNTMLATVDGLHPNDYGNAFIADRIQEEILHLGFSQGVNSMTGTSAGTYATPSPAYAGPGATAPNARTGVTATNGNQMTVTWTRTGDGGATITGQPVQASSDGGTTWVTVGTASPSASTYTIGTGLTEATSYVIRVGATNSVGTTYSTASAAATAGAPLATYFADTFTRADNPSSAGTTETGGYTWAATNSGTLAIASNKLTATQTTTNVDVDAYVDDGHANGTLKGTLVANTGVSVGLMFRASAVTDGYVLWCQTSSTKNWILSRRTGASTYSQIAIVATGTGAPGDEAKVVMNGTDVKVYINGALVYTLTDSFNTTKTRHGLWRSGQTGTTTATMLDNIEHSSLVA